MDQDLKDHLEALNKNLILVRRGVSWWRALLHGIMTGLGSVVGVIIAIILLGWALNIIGIIPALKNETTQWKNLLQKAQQQRLPSSVPADVNAR